MARAFRAPGQDLVSRHDVDPSRIVARLRRFKGARLRAFEASELHSLVTDSIASEAQALAHGFDVEQIETALESILVAQLRSAAQLDAWRRFQALAQPPLINFLRRTRLRADAIAATGSGAAPRDMLIAKLSVAERIVQRVFDRLYHAQQIDQDKTPRRGRPRDPKKNIPFHGLRGFPEWLSAPSNRAKDVADFLRIVASFSAADVFREIANETVLVLHTNLTPALGGVAPSMTGFDLRRALRRVIGGIPAQRRDLCLTADEVEVVVTATIMAAVERGKRGHALPARLRTRMDRASIDYPRQRWSAAELDIMMMHAMGIELGQIAIRLRLQLRDVKCLHKSASRKYATACDGAAA